MTYDIYVCIMYYVYVCMNLYHKRRNIHKLSLSQGVPHINPKTPFMEVYDAKLSPLEVSRSQSGRAHGLQWPRPTIGAEPGMELGISGHYRKWP